MAKGQLELSFLVSLGQSVVHLTHTSYRDDTLCAHDVHLLFIAECHQNQSLSESITGLSYIIDLLV